MRTSRRLSIFAVVTAVSLLSTACAAGTSPTGTGTSPTGTPATGTSTPAQSQAASAGAIIDTLTVPVVDSYSGSVAAFGTNGIAGLNLALQPLNNVVNGHKIVLQKVDDQCTPDVAVTEVSKLLDTATLIIGPACSGDVLAVEDAVHQAGIPQMHLGSLYTPMSKGYKNLFQIPVSDKAMRSALISWAKKNFNVTKWAVLHDTSGYGAGGDQIFLQIAQAAGVQVVANTSYNGGEKNFTGILTNLDKSGADAIHLIGYDTDLAQITKTAKQLGIKTPIYGDIDYNTQTFLDAAAGSAEGQYFVATFIPDEQNPEITSFIAAVKAAGVDTSGETADGYIAGLALIEALKTINGPVTKDNLIAALAQVNIANSPEGPVMFGPDGARAGTGLVIIGKIVNGKPTFYARL